MVAAVFFAVVVIVQLGLGKQPVAPNRLAVAGKRAVAVELGFLVFDFAARVYAVVEIAVFAQVVLAVETVAPSPVFFVVMLVLQVELVGDEGVAFRQVTGFPVGADMVFAI